MRPLIDARVPSTILAVICAVLTGISALALTRMANVGTALTHIYAKSSQFQNDIETYFGSTQSEMWILATNVSSHLPSKMDQILSRLKAGVKIKYLVFDPFSQRLPLVAEGFGTNTKDLQAQCVFSTQSLIRLFRDWTAIRKTAPRHGEVEIRFYDDIPRSRLYVVDPNVATGTTVLVPYMSHHSTLTLPIYFHNYRQMAFGFICD
jgi:DNA polymerase elongation subunit (family B)